MEIRRFRSEYHLDLIPASHEGISLGDLVWDPLIGPPDFSRKGVPNTIYTAFLDAGLINEAEWKEFSQEIRSARLADAHFATRRVDVNVDYLQDLGYPTLGSLETELRIDRLRKFSFSDLQVREMENLLRIRIDQLLERMKEAKWKEYDGQIRRVFMITELYYGQVSMVVDEQYSPELDASLEKAAIRTTGKIKGRHAVEYAFSHDNVPFAMRIERVRSFNG